MAIERFQSDANVHDWTICLNRLSIERIGTTRIQFTDIYTQRKFCSRRCIGKPKFKSDYISNETFCGFSWFSFNRTELCMRGAIKMNRRMCSMCVVLHIEFQSVHLLRLHLLTIPKEDFGKCMTEIFWGWQPNHKYPVLKGM